MKKLKLFFILFALIIINANLRAQSLAVLPTFSNFYNGSKQDNLYSIASLPNNNYMLAGKTNSNDGYISNNHGETDAWLIKVNGNGDTIWSKCYGGSNQDYFTSIIYSDNYIYAVGGTNSIDGDIHNISSRITNGAGWFVKLDTNGNILYENCFGGLGIDDLKKIKETPNKGFIIVGTSTSDSIDLTKNNGFNDGWILKLDSNYNIEWSKSYGGSSFDMFHDVFISNSEKYYVCGSASCSNDFDVHCSEIWLNDAWVLCLDLDGDTIWTKCFGSSGAEAFFSALLYDNNRLFFGGTYGTFEGESVNIGYIIELDTNGLEQNQIISSNLSTIRSLKRSNNNSIYGCSNMQLFNIDNNLTPQWIINTSLSFVYPYSDILQNSSNFYYLVGYYNLINSDGLLEFYGAFVDIIINAGYNDTICIGESTVLTAIPSETDFAILWSTADTSASITVSPTVTTTYYVTASKDSVILTDSVIVYVGTVPTAEAGNNISICLNNSDTLIATGGSYYSWSNGETTASIIVNPTITTQYFVTAYSDLGCYSIDSINVTVLNSAPIAGIVYLINGAPVVDEGEYKTITQGGALVISTTNTNCTYSWSNGATTQSIRIIPPTGVYTYTLTVTENACTDIDNVVINVITGTQSYSCGTTNPFITNLTTVKAKINWNTIDYATGYMVRYRMKNPTGSWYYFNASSLDSLWNISSLIPDTTYEFQVRTYCDGGYYSNFTALDTLRTLPCSTPTGLDESSITATSAVLSWSELTGADHYLLRWRVQHPDSTWQYTIVYAPENTKTIGCIVCDSIDMLRINTTYEWQIIKHCDSSEDYPSLFSSIETFSTLSGKSYRNNIFAKNDQNEFSCNIYPNPTNKNATIDLSIPQNTYINIELYDILGSKILDVYKGNNTQGLYKYTVNTLGLKPNTYILRIAADTNISHYQLIVIE